MRRQRLAATVLATMVGVTGMALPTSTATGATPSATVTLAPVPANCIFLVTANWSGYDVRYVSLTLTGQALKINGKHVTVLYEVRNSVDATAGISGTSSSATWTTAPISTSNGFYASATLYGQDPAAGAQPLVQVVSPTLQHARCDLPPRS